MIAPQDAQAPAARPTVGDTITVVHRAAVPAGALVQPRGPTDSLLATLAAVPEVSREGDSVRIAYTLAVWSPGEHVLEIPGAVVVQGNGTVDTLPAARVTLRVASVLPEGRALDSIAARPAATWVTPTERSLLPLVVLLLPLALAAAIVVLWWRRRGPWTTLPTPAAVAPTDLADRLRRWHAAGEHALVLDHLIAALGDSDASRVWRADVARVRFDPHATAEVAELVERGLALLGTPVGSR